MKRILSEDAGWTQHELGAQQARELPSYGCFARSTLDLWIGPDTTREYLIPSPTHRELILLDKAPLTTCKKCRINRIAVEECDYFRQNLDVVAFSPAAEKIYGKHWARVEKCFGCDNALVIIMQSQGDYDETMGQSF